MSHPQTFERLEAVIRERLDMGTDPIGLDSRLEEDLSLDSVDTLDLLMAIEDEFKIDMDDFENSGIVTVRDVVDLINKKLADNA